MDDFAVALSDICRAYPALMPPNRIRVSEGAQKLIIKRPGGASGPWDPYETPYMVEPTDMLASRIHSAVCFVGPAQTGKTVALGEGWLTHAVLNDPGDMAIFQMTQDKAREYSKQRVDRAIRNSPALKAMRSVSSRDDNLHDKQFKNGMWLRIAWPTASNMSSTSYRYVFGTDYDRWNQGKDDVDGEGDGFTLMGKRVTTFLSRGMVAVESSPGRPMVDPTWVPSTPHEAPPVGTEETGGGILGIYNRGDRRRWYWRCPHCAERFEAAPGLGLFRLPPDDQLLEDIRSLDIDKFARQYARIACPLNGCVVSLDSKEKMNRGGIWVPDGVTVDIYDRFSGNPRTSSIASYWLGGVAATYVKWETLIQKHLQALLAYDLTGSEQELQTTVNTDQGAPYMSRILAAAADANKLARKPSTHERYVVPDEARFLVASVDVQGGKNARFEVQVHAIGPNNEEWLVNRFAIKESKREGLGDRFAPIDPSAYPEDWDVLNDVLTSTYRTSIEGKELRLRLLVVDTGGEDGVTNNAYAWYRRLRKAHMHRRVRLTKGSSTRTDWHIKESMVGAEQSGGDVPLWLLNTDLLKDMVKSSLDRPLPGPGYYHFPAPKHLVENPNGWLPQSFFDELHAEVRGEDGKWTQVKKRNESLDLCVMIKAGLLMLKANKRTFWDDPPSWALPLKINTDVIGSETRRMEKETAAAIVAAAPPPPPAPAPAPAGGERRVRHSAYLR